MSAGLFALLDDVAVLARAAAASVDDISAAAAKATAKAAGVVVDDTAVTPQYVQGVTADREIPIVKRIAIGSIRNKLLLILPAIMILSQFVPWVLTPILMLGGAYLCFEGAEKIWGKISGHDHTDSSVLEQGPDAEAKLIGGAIRTDLILSAEIMVISLNEVDHYPFFSRLVILTVVAIVITIVVYGVVALIVKMDDAGLRLARSRSERLQRMGHALVAGMPKLLSVITVVGTIAMLWVGGHIILVGTDELGWHGPYSLVHHLEEPIHSLAGVGGVLGWIVNTVCSAVVGLLVGAVIVAVVTLLPFGKHDDHGSAETAASPGPDAAPDEPIGH